VNYPQVSVIILNHNGLDDTLECLESLKKVTYPNRKVVVVDNGSKGNDVEILRQTSGHDVHLVENDRNWGFAEGNNIGIRYALTVFDPAYLLLLNNDTVVAPDLLNELVAVAESQPDIGIVSPKIYWYDFRGRSDVVWYAGGRIRWWHPAVYRIVGRHSDDLPQYQGVATTDWASGAAMMIKRTVLGELSLLNSRYFFGNEDIEYCLKARKRGFRTAYVPTAMVWHKMGASRNRRAITPKVLLNHVDNHYRFISGNFSALVWAYHVLLLPVFLLHSFWFCLLDRKRRHTLPGLSLVSGKDSLPSQ